MKMAIGIDVHKEKCAACAVYAGQGEATAKNLVFLKKFNEDFKRFPTDADGMKMLADRIKYRPHSRRQNFLIYHRIQYLPMSLK